MPYFDRTDWNTTTRTRSYQRVMVDGALSTCCVCESGCDVCLVRCIMYVCWMPTKYTHTNTRSLDQLSKDIDVLYRVLDN